VGYKSCWNCSAMVPPLCKARSCTTGFRSPSTHPKAKLEAIITGYVVIGTLESGNTRRIIPPESANAGQPGMYMSLFQQLSLNAPPDPPPAPLFPEPKEPPIPAGTPLPPAGEAIDEPVETPWDNSHIVHVEIEE